MVGGARPVIAAVAGDAFGAGMSMAAACNHVFAAKNARFGATFTKIGIVPDVGLFYTLPQRIGLSRARNMMMLAEPISGEEAFRIELDYQPICSMSTDCAEGILAFREKRKAAFTGA